ncbi:CGH_1_HP_G0099410.mRNA.1.CDS.1 [Saccharomyces cerevisiae]|nr:CGH_1_HP_G0099410.mRNA.1.CDS.1 [Saccharomyces cerevisiae]CAI6946200.1 CGH_1_HP_G0099410.mRNA.1.CDS.1 [Saccharomyces cerevisiae]
MISSSDSVSFHTFSSLVFVPIIVHIIYTTLEPLAAAISKNVAKEFLETVPSDLKDPISLWFKQDRNPETIEEVTLCKKIRLE